jgi:hypothetical protein
LHFLNLSTTYRIIATLLALNYFSFQVELFDAEYEANHRTIAETASIAAPSLTWESFDKNNAPQAFVFDAGLRTDFLFELPSSPHVVSFLFVAFRLIRDKSPPFIIL